MGRGMAGRGGMGEWEGVRGGMGTRGAGMGLGG